MPACCFVQAIRKDESTKAPMLPALARHVVRSASAQVSGLAGKRQANSLSGNQASSNPPRRSLEPQRQKPGCRDGAFGCAPCWPLQHVFQPIPTKCLVDTLWLTPASKPTLCVSGVSTGPGGAPSLQDMPCSMTFLHHWHQHPS